jgi:NADH-quinone oxidoreductase subunit L
MVNFLDLIWLIPLFPLCGAAIMLLFGKLMDPQPHSHVALADGVGDGHHHHDHGHGHHHHAASTQFLVKIISPGMVLLSLIFSIGAVVQLASKAERIHQVIQYTWLAGLPFHMQDGRIGIFTADWGFLLDPLSSVMILVVTGIGFLIHVYSIAYMAHDTGYYRFFGYMNLFVFFMLMLVLANNYVLLFVGWEGVGLCSYLLIGFYFDKKSAGDAGKKAFIVNRIGDSGFILGMLLLFSVVGTLRFTDMNHALANFRIESGHFGVLSVAALLLFIGATGKSAQVPLYIWLPDAMEGPTPVSALIHAATMVTAGVYMVARSNALFKLTPETSAIVAVIGALTAILAASIALVQNDIKRVLAYSTVSQLGYMFMALGAGAYWVAVFHLYTHAFFKALLFLGAGSVIHAMSGEQDMRKMGGLKNKIKVTYWTMAIASLALAGIPGFAGFFSKEEILWQTWSSPLGSKAIYIVGLVTALMTAFYKWRLMFMTFHGECRASEHTQKHIHESPVTMTAVLSVLAAGSIVAGWIGVQDMFNLPEFFSSFKRWLEPVFASAAAHEIAHEAAHDVTIEWTLMILTVTISVIGIFLAYRLYVKKPSIPESLSQSSGPLYTALLNKWYVDEIYDFLFVNGLCKGGGTVLGIFDRKVVDGGVNGAGWLTKFVSTVSIWFDTWVVDGAVRLSSFLVKLSSYPVRILQTGSVQSYALIFVLGVAAIFGYYVAR